MPEFLRFPRIIPFLLLGAFASMVAVLFTPALPELTEALHLVPAQSQWAMSIYLIGFAVGPLLYGPLGNRLGRKKAVLFGIGLAIVGSFVTSITSSFEMLCFGRFLQGLGASVGFKMTGTMIGDSCSGAEATKALGILYLGFAILPYGGLTIGGFLTTWFGWRGPFVFCTLYSAFLFVCCLWLPETVKQLHPDALQWKQIVQHYLAQFKNRTLLLLSIYFGLGTGMIYVFANQAPFIGIDWMQLTPKQYGLFGLLLPVGMIVGLTLANRLAEKVSINKALVSGMLCIGFSALLMGICFLNEWRSGWSLFLPQTLLLIGPFFTGPFGYGKALSDATDKSHASAVFQFLNLSCTTLATLFAGTWMPQVAIALPIVYVCILAGMFAAWLGLRKRGSL